jgi:hypothetical protein
VHVGLNKGEAKNALANPMRLGWRR